METFGHLVILREVTNKNIPFISQAYGINCAPPIMIDAVKKFMLFFEPFLFETSSMS